MAEDFLLLNPGPVPVTDEVLDSMSEPMVSHRSADFEAVYERAQDALDYIFTNSTRSGASTAEEGTSLVFNGTATMGMEAAVANLVGNGGNVVSLVNGKFGRRFARIADRYADVTRVEVEWGESIPLDAVEAAITDDTDVVTMVHNETSTGLLNPAEAVGEVAAAHDATFVVDGVTSIGGDEFKIDDWNVDIAITDSQKALAAPPGVSAMYVTERVKDRIDGETAPFYEDLDWHLRKAEQHQTPFTSAVPLFRALAVAVEDIVEETMSARIERHRRQSAAFRAGFEAMGLELFANADGETELSNTLTAVSLPEAVYGDDSDAFFDGVTARNVSISGGQAHLGGQIFRVSNMGGLAPEHIVRGIRTVGEAMADAGVDVDVEAGIEAAEAELAEEQTR
ncbi:aminotransferase class V (serine--pyruvate aminotransferase / alanine--glyoxylate aminotransferase) [Haloferax mucosum ATCC BAA-1512]|uniref:Aminotransferase class V (Serine--pyruvate aminotransferase / alanine--glyoxylate aminotransferase) n=1 Tax=Haloferax mucosum ATCC BAA-1512 TaxID=662479 RepID=M0IHG3_9EURY|nr:alanine--glyoxylate aminotransferase family protein [Haloferax mucosum]ELZ95298.1 aminotransferase class V (serine--pyruvate aminotransferase / alanine--glyoxylate aminotransferase) [Haloferax mucosum ATCC BAA-1512]